MANSAETIRFEDAPLQILDGDRGANYPNQRDFSLSGHCLFLNAGNVTSDGFKFNEVSFISKEKDNSLRKGKMRRGDIVMTTRGTVGNVALFDNSVQYEDIRINSGMVIIRVDENRIEPRFLYCFLRSTLFQMQVLAFRSGSAVPQLPIRDIKRIELPLPFIEEQRQIAHVLGTLDDKIELNRQLNATLEQLGQTLFQSWFVDFDPVRAKASGESEASICRRLGLTPELLALFPAALEESVMGKIPAGWEVSAIEKTLNILSGFAFKSGSFHSEGHYGLVTIRNVQDGHFVNDTREFIAKPPPNMPSYCQLSSGDILLSLTGNVGRICFVVGENFLLNQRVAKIEAKEKAERSFAYFFMRRKKTQSQLISIARGTAQLNLSPIETKRLSMILPPTSIRKSYAQIVEPLFQKLVANEEESRTLAALRDELLPKLLSSDLRLN